jgi:hypothetical protein
VQVARHCKKSCGVCDAAPPALAGGGRSRPLGLWLAYLLSYERMGRTQVARPGSLARPPALPPSRPLHRLTRVPSPGQVSCSGSCSCSAVIDAHNVLAQTSVTAVQRVFVSQDDSVPGCCYVTLTVLPQTSSGQTKFKLLSLLLAQQQRKEVGSQPDWQPPGIKVIAAPTLGDLMHYSGPADQ